MTEAISYAGSAKTAVSEYYTTQGKMPSDSDQAGIDLSDTDLEDAEHVQSVAYTRNGDDEAEISVGVGDLGGDIEEGDNLVFTGTGSASGVSWSCGSSDIDSSYLPSNCRGGGGGS
nr:pilin [Salinisphaera halophila]